jgi:hypothetical protein
MFIVSWHFRLHTTFQFSKHICEHGIFHIFPEHRYFSDVPASADFRSFEHRQKISYIRKISEYLKLFTFINIQKFVIFNISFSGSIARCPQNLETFTGYFESFPKIIVYIISPYNLLNLVCFLNFGRPRF